MISRDIDSLKKLEKGRRIQQKDKFIVIINVILTPYNWISGEYQVIYHALKTHHKKEENPYNFDL